MSDKTVSVGLRIDGDARGGVQAIDTTEKALQKLDAAGKITLLEGAEKNARDLATEIERTRQHVQSLETTLSEAYAAGADDQLIKRISKQLDEARREADAFSTAADRNSVALNRVKLAAREAGIDLDNLAGERVKLERLAQSTNTLQNSFSTLRIRSADQIEADLLEVNQALVKLAQRTDLAGDEFDRAFAAGQKRIASLKAELRGTPEEVERVGQKASNLLSLMGGLGLAFSGAELARQFVLVNVELENVERSFVAITGSTSAATQEMDYARGVAARLGLEQISTARAYADLMAATKGTAAEGENSRAVFEAVARSMSLAGKSSADTEGALLALQQMASKGVVSMEELRGQLGERLPGALNAAAEGLGITTAQLIKLTESGQLTAEELFPALAAGLNKLYAGGGAETVTQEWNHFKTAVQDTYEVIGDAGAVNVMKGALEGLSAYLMVVSGGVVALGQKIGVFLAGLANGDIGLRGFSDNAKQAFADIEQAAQQRLLKAAEHNDVLAAMMGDAGRAAQAAAKAQGEAASTAASDWTRLNVAYGTVKESGETATKQAVAHAEAVKAESAASVELASALGGEADKHLAKASAARANAVAMAEVAERRREELAMATEHVAALQREAEANGGATEQQQKVIDGLLKIADARQTDADKASAQAESARISAVQAQVEATAYDQARGALSQWSAAKQAQLSVDQAGIRLAIEQQRTILEVARARGDEYGATQALLRIKQLEIQLAELTARAKMAEANATLLSVQAQRHELEVKGFLNEAKRAELDAMEAGARVKQIESQIASETARRMRELVEVTDFSGASAGRAAGHFDSLAGSLRGVAAQASNAIGALSDLDRYEQNKYNLPGGSSSILDGGRSAGGPINAKRELYERGASVEEVALAEKYYSEFLARNQATMLTGNLMSESRHNLMTQRAMQDAADKALAAARQEMASGQAVDMGVSVKDLIDRNLATMNRTGLVTDSAGIAAYQKAIKSAGLAANAQVTRVDLRTNKGTTSVNLASSQDSSNLIAVLKELQSRAM
jgi:tape measure domain-containing protein